MADYPLTAEGWTWYSVVMVVVISRYISRWIQLRSIKKYATEDYVMIVVAMLYTAEIVFLVKISGTPTNLFPPDQPYDPNNTADIQLRIYGSKLIVALEQVYCAAIWGCKACLLLFYLNMTFSLPVSYTWTKLVACYVFMGYFVMVILYFGVWCLPFYDYWSVPALNPQCSTAENHLKLNCVLNISSDIMIMLIPLPLLVKTHLPWRKKILLCAIFSLGAFVILSAALNKYYSFEHPYGNDWVFWYTREVSTAVIVANIPHLWALIRKVLGLRTFMTNQTTQQSWQHSERETPARFFGSIDDPLEPRRPLKVASSLDSVDIDRVLADAEREVTPMEPVRFRDLRESETTWLDPERGEKGPPTSPSRAYLVPPPPPLSPLTIDSNMRLLVTSPSPPRTPKASPRSFDSLRPS